MSKKRPKQMRYYRIWDPEFQEYNDDFWVYALGGVDHDTALNLNDVIVERCSGKEDLNGQFIFEGDIVRLNLASNPPDLDEAKGVYEVIYNTLAGQFELKVHKNNWFCMRFITVEEAKKLTSNPKRPFIAILTQPLSIFGGSVIEVIGNINENGDLLK